MNNRRETASDLLEQVQRIEQRLVQLASDLIWEENSPQQVQLAQDALNSTDATINALVDLVKARQDA